MQKKRGVVSLTLRAREKRERSEVRKRAGRKCTNLCFKEVLCCETSESIQTLCLTLYQILVPPNKRQEI